VRWNNKKSGSVFVLGRQGGLGSNWTRTRRRGAARPVSFLGPLFFSRQFRAEEEKGAIIIRDALCSYY
jgi:hypothetical protein